MKALQDIVHELETLPADKLEEAVRLIHRLKQEETIDRKELLENACGNLSQEDADELERVIGEGCEKINADRGVGNPRK